MRLYRPVGLEELRLIAQSNWRVFPPRLEHQPIFYPVLNLEYAQQIARDWNTKDEASGYAGFVTQFEVVDSYVSNFEVKIVGSSKVHQELWVPAEELGEFNTHIEGPITTQDAFYGSKFSEQIDTSTNLPIGLATVMESS